MPPNTLDSTVNPCLEYVKYLKPFEVIQSEKCLCKRGRLLNKKESWKEDEERDRKIIEGLKGANTSGSVSTRLHIATKYGLLDSPRPAFRELPTAYFVNHRTRYSHSTSW